MKNFKLLLGILALTISLLLFYFYKDTRGVSSFLQGLFFAIGTIFVIRYLVEKFKK